MDKVKVGGLEYTIKEKPVVEVYSDKNCYGSCDRDNLLIELSNGVPKVRKDQVLIHEIMHAAMDEAGLELDNEEFIVTHLSKVWYQVLKENDFAFLNN